MLDRAALIADLPEEPGVYRMLDVADAVLYVGKAKNLRRRVASYFQRTALSPRVRLMVEQIERVEVTATRSEAEALLLENNLIKGLAPKYNIIFRDDKSYPYIMVSAAAYPRLGFHRGSFDGKSRYFGPFPNTTAVRESIQLIQRTFRLRTCEESVFRNRSRPCLLHQIQRCTAPCVGLVSEEDYARDVRLAAMFLEGRSGEAIAALTAKMDAAAEALAFEQAAAFRDQIRSLQQVLHRTYVTSGGEEDADVIAAAEDDGSVCITLAMVRGGVHLGDRSVFPRAAERPGASEALEAFLEQHYAALPAPGRVIVNLPLDQLALEAVHGVDGLSLTVSNVSNANERAWMEMAEKNARIALSARSQEATRSAHRIAALQGVLGLPDRPCRIECFDVSHTSGESAVASCVVFAGGRMQSSEYRRYNMRGIAPGDDYAALRQALRRRYEKMVIGGAVRPDLILIDGGKGQLAVARKVLIELGLEDIDAVGVAKGQARKPGDESLVFADDGRADLCLGAASPALQLVQEIRDEAHRFAVAGHRARRAKTRRSSRLEDIPGVGAVRRKRLLTQFGGMQGVVAATIEDLCGVPGIDHKLAEQIYRSLR